ncbi:srpk [Purpureocillium lavendulum]|uniref:Srpk n=1 Tax=Purpureocillium lavendulum TaxID=1247861 RepID=A0AB34FTJ3_9HYPO|nr:srpk [Purpureocillium lavendulum]
MSLAVVVRPHRYAPVVPRCQGRPGGVKDDEEEEEQEAEDARQTQAMAAGMCLSVRLSSAYPRRPSAVSVRTAAKERVAAHYITPIVAVRLQEKGRGTCEVKNARPGTPDLGPPAAVKKLKAPRPETKNLCCTEAWTEYGLGVVILFLRFFSRWKTVGFKGWEGDDAFAILVLLFWTVRQYGTNIGITDDVGATLTSEQIARFEFGSKCLLAGWNFYVALIWALKGCMLCFYNRITLGLTQQKFVKWTGLACFFAYAGVMGAIWGHCTPVHKNWQVVPYPGGELNNNNDDNNKHLAIMLTRYMATRTDFVILSIPIPLLWKVKITLGRKIAIGVLLCSGVFIIVATILRCVLSLRDIQGINVSTIWAIRETFVGIIAVNAAAIKPLFSKSRWITSSKGSSGATPGYNKNQNQYSLDHMPGGATSTIGSMSKRRFNKQMMEMGDNSSEEHIVDSNNNGLAYNKWLRNEVSGGGGGGASSVGGRSGGSSAEADGITVTTRVEVTPGTPRHMV